MTSTPVPSLQLCMRAYLPCPGASLRLIWMIPTGDSSAAAVSAVATDCPTAAVLDHLLFPHRCAMIDQQMFLGLVQTSAVRWFLLVSPMVRSCVAGIMVVPLQPAVYICVAALRSCCLFDHLATRHLLICTVGAPLPLPLPIYPQSPRCVKVLILCATSSQATSCAFCQHFITFLFARRV